MSISRYDKPVSIRSSFVPKEFIPQEFTPNFKLYDAALRQNQDLINKTRDLSNLPIDALSGADEKYAQELRDELSSRIDNTAKAYKESVSKGAKASRDLLRSVQRDTLPGGKYYELAQRKQQYNKFYKEQSDRLAKGDITDFQFQESVARAKAEYDSSGGYKNSSNLNLSQRQNAVNFDKFANDFLKNFKADKGMSGDMRIVDGKLIYDTKELTQLEADKVLKDLSNAYYNAASTTGQLTDRFNYLKRSGRIDKELLQDNRIDAQNLLSTYSNPKSKSDIKKLQKELNKLGSNLTVDGIMGKNTQAALDQVADLASMNDSEFNSAQKNNYLSNYIRQISAPYADAKSYREYAENAKSFGNTLARDKAMKDYEVEVQNRLETLNTQVYTKGSGMKDFDINIGKDGKIKSYTNNPNYRLPGKGVPLTADTRMTVVDKNANKSFKEYLSSENAAKDNPQVVAMYNEFKGYIDKLSDKEAHKFIKTKYEEKQRALSTADAKYIRYNPDTQKTQNIITLGNLGRTGVAKVGNIRNKTLWVRDGENSVKPMSFDAVLEKYDITPEQFVANGNILGEIKSANDHVPSGEEGNYTDPEGKFSFSFTASNISNEDSAFKTPDFILFEPANNGSKNQSDFTYTGIQELDEKYGMIQSKAEDIYRSDIIIEQMRNEDLPQSQLNLLGKELKKLQTNPSLDTYQERRVELFDKYGKSLTDEGLTLSKITQLKEAIRNGRK